MKCQQCKKFMSTSKLVNRCKCGAVFWNMEKFQTSNRKARKKRKRHARRLRKE